MEAVWALNLAATMPFVHVFLDSRVVVSDHPWSALVVQALMDTRSAGRRPLFLVKLRSSIVCPRPKKGVVALKLSERTR